MRRFILITVGFFLIFSFTDCKSQMTLPSSSATKGKIEEDAQKKGIKLPYRPWHLADIWWYFPKETQHFKRLDIDVTLDRDIPESFELYVAPIGLVSLNDIRSYGGLQTNIGGWPSKQSQKVVRPGKGGIFSRWSTKEGEPIGLEYVDMPEGALCESNGYEGEFCSVRRPYKWKAGTYTFSLIKEETITFKNTPHTWISLNITSLADQSKFKIGRLLFEGNDFTLWDEHAAFVEIYGDDSDIPELKITFGLPRLNGEKAECKTALAVRPTDGLAGAPNCAIVTTKNENIIVEIAPVIQTEEFLQKRLYLYEWKFWRIYPKI